MNGARSTFKRKGYLLTALAVAVLLAASPGIASAQSIGFVGSSGSVSETASLEIGALEGPHTITIRTSGLRPPGTPNRTDALGTVTLTSSHAVTIAQVLVTNPRDGQAAVTAGAAWPGLAAADFAGTDEVTLVIAQDATGGKDPNWFNEPVKLTLDAGAGVEVSPNIYTVTVMDTDVAPVAKFNVPSFTLTEGSERAVALDVTEGRLGAGIPEAAEGINDAAGGTDNAVVTIRVSNSGMVTLMDCPGPRDPGYNRKAVRLDLMDGDWPTVDAAAESAFGRTGLLRTSRTVGDLAGRGDAAADMANFTIEACGDMAGFSDPEVTLTIMSTNLVERPGAGVNGDITIGSPLMITIDSDEAAPTLSFSPTDVTIDEGGSTSTRLIADGRHATEVGMVKLMVEGDAMVDLYHEDTMLEEMDGYVYVDLGTNNTARLTAMSTSDPDLMDGDMAYKAWKLTDDSSDAAIGDDYWFRVDVRGSTAVPALPLVGQLLLALFLMAGGSRLYRRRNG